MNEMPLTYADIVALEPRILEAEALARQYAGSPTYERWYDEIKSRFKLLVGWMSKHPDERLHSSDAYNTVYSHLINIYELKEPTMNKSEIIIDGVIYNRIPFGAEQDDDGGACCPDCGVNRGEFHLPNCDQETCPKCGGQLIGCDCVSRVVNGNDGESASEESKEQDYDAPRSLGSSDAGRRLSHVAELLRFADAGLDATQQGNHGAQLVIQEAIREIRTVMDSNIKVIEIAIPF